MADFRWIHPDYGELASQHQLDELDALMARRDGALLTPPHQRRREVLRLELPARSGKTSVLYLKRERDVRWRYLAGQVLRGRGLWTPARTELEVLLHMAEAGVTGPRPVLCLQRLGMRSQGCLLLEAVPSPITLNHYLATHLRHADAGRRKQFFAQLGNEIARLHGSGVYQPQLYCTHIYLLEAESDGAELPQVGFWGFRRARLLNRLALSHRVDGLAALVATLPRRLASMKDRETLFEAYLNRAELKLRRMELNHAVAQQVEHLLTHRHVWEMRESDTEEHRSVRPLESIEQGQMWIDREYRAALEQANLTSFDRVMGTDQGRLLRRLPDRENWRLELHMPHGSTRGAYLKKHHIRTPRTRVRALAQAGGGLTAGRVEADNVVRLARSGIAAMKLIAYGEKLHEDGLLESFILTEELHGFTQLDHFLQERFAPLATDRAAPRDPHLMKLIAEVASVAAKFHRLGYNHRDLYCCHFFIKETQPGEFKVNLIDLQRVEHRRHFRSRWLVKDLGQLAYSAPVERISRTHKMAFIKHYLGVRRLRPRDKRFIRKILARQRWIDMQVRKREKSR